MQNNITNYTYTISYILKVTYCDKLMQLIIHVKTVKYLLSILLSLNYNTDYRHCLQYTKFTYFKF